MAENHHHHLNDQFDLIKSPHHHSPAFNSSYHHPDLFHFTFGHKINLISRSPRNRLGPFNIFQDQFAFLNDRFNFVVLFVLIANLIAMGLEIFVFKAFAHHALVDTGLTRVYSWPLSSLIVVNYLICTGIRLYFARLASTTLRAPKLFLLISLFLLIASLVGIVFQSVLVGAHLMGYEEIQLIFTGNGGRQRVLRELLNDLTNYFAVIGADRIKLDLLQLAWLAPPLLWDLLISAVLMSNVLDSRKRCRFGSVENRISLGILVVFETLLLATIASLMVLCLCLVLGSKVNMDFERMSTIYGGFDGLITKLHTISIFCSLQHKVNDRLRIGHNLILSSRRKRGSALGGGYGLDHSVGYGEPTSHGRETRKAAPSIHFPDFEESMEVEVLEGDDDDDDDNVEDQEDDELGGGSGQDCVECVDTPTRGAMMEERPPQSIRLDLPHSILQPPPPARLVLKDVHVGSWGSSAAPHGPVINADDDGLHLSKA